MSTSNTPSTPALTQDQLKTLVGQAALQYVVPGEIVGVGGLYGEQVHRCLASIKDQIGGAVSSSVASTERLKALGIPVFDSNDVPRLSVYIDGADEIDGRGNMIKGWRCGVDAREDRGGPVRPLCLHCRRVQTGPDPGAFPLPVEVIPMATQRVIAQFAALGGVGTVRQRDGKPLVTDNGQYIVDVTGLKITDPWPSRRRSVSGLA